MRKTLVSLAGILLFAAAVSAAPCTPSATSLCLSSGRFQVSVSWTDFQNRTGDGQAVSLTADTGYFCFFSASNVELIVKVLDARALNGKFWVFFGALSNVEYTLTVRDSVTGSTKTYQNPSGQFASVGDTTAFDGSAGVSLVANKTMIVGGTAAPPASIAEIQRFRDRAAPAAADFAPCSAPPTNLLLSGCRFRVHVSWQDSQGMAGEGQGVQLTGDTGYFWFFNASNVELMVKVLDARAINGNFWVFFGALSNVAYTVTIFDTVTNTLRQYTNAPGTFASVGDTAAFAGGRSVGAVPDSARAVSKEIDAAGGTITANGADRTVYTLVVPANSIFFPTEITMTPLDHIDGFPFSGGLKGGVQLEPEGLILFQGATLSIAPPTPIPQAELAPFSYEATGANFILYPVIPNVPGVQLAISHFSGYGAGSGSPADIANQAGTTPSGPFAPYAQQAAEIQEEFFSNRISDADAKAQIRQLFIDALNQVVLPTLQAVQNCDPDAINAAVRLTIDWGRTAGFFLDDNTYANLQQSALMEIKRIALDCIDQAFEKCVSQNDTGQVRLILAIARTLELLGLVSDAEYAQIFDKVERCLRFEVDFDSSIEVNSGPVIFYQKVQAAVPVRLEAGQSTFFLSGSGTMQFVLATLSPGESNPCTYRPSDVQNSVFEVVKLLPGGPERAAYNVRMLYGPGDPQENDHQICPYVGEQSTGFYSLWASEFEGLHEDEVRVPNPLNYEADSWTIVPYGNYPAAKNYERSGSIGGEPASESTHILLKHTPDAPLP